MKKLLIVKLIFLLVLIVLCNIWYIKYYYIKKDNDELKFKIEKAQIESKNYSIKTESIESDIEKLKEEKQDRVEELETWQLMEEKIKKAL